MTGTIVELAQNQDSSKNPQDKELARQMAEKKKLLVAEIKKRIVGQEVVIDELLVTLFSGGHGLFVGVPGLAKTLLISTLAQALHLQFNRVQFTPDLMPSDVTGTDVLEEDHTTGRRQFRFIKGPLFANLLLADEINRTPPKTQAALLQAMQERRVTAGGNTYDLPRPFHVFATQNPIEQEGTYPLPEAQLDRFMLMIDVGYPSFEEELDIVESTTSTTTGEVKPVLTPQEIEAFQNLVPKVPIGDAVLAYAVKLVRASRPAEETAPDFVKNYLSFGAGPRSAQHLVLAAKARALLSGRFAVDVDDIRSLARSVLQHRLILNFRAEAERLSPTKLISMLLDHSKP
ncbi:MAG: MoxR family ATPase [Deltaproteobacteria bacterium]|nr:MoxR family ATPase [Deltaproteobacteria bacterium]